MNKKLFTLAVSALALLTCSLSANAQNATYDATRSVKVAKAALSDKQIKSIDPAKWYQVEIAGDTQSYLTVHRNATTGELYLYGETAAEPAYLNESLWKITPVRHGVAGYTYTLTNKATGFALTFNDKELTSEPQVKALRSDVTEWQWYSDPIQPTVLDFTPFYAYNHAGTEVIGLNSGKTTGELEVLSVAKASFKDRDGGNLFLKLRVVEALPRVLSAAEVNTMIDASNAADGVLFKSTPVVENALFGTQITAEPVKANAPSGNYAGYDVMLKNTATKEYFFVDQDSTYDFVTLPVANGGFKVHFAPLAKAVASATADSTVQANDANFVLDALSARYIWRVTYYPTPDSLVLEPLNASSVSKYDKQAGTTWLKSKQATATIDQYFNTVNEAKAAPDGTASTAATSVNFNKAAKAVVALTIYNRGDGSYDQSSVLTVGTALNAIFGYKEASEATAIEGANYNQTPADTTAHMGIRIYFDNAYNYLERATLADGLYFIQLASKANNDLFRKAGKYIVANHRGNLMYDSPTTTQNYIHMPATQWVVAQDTCNVSADGTPTVSFTNREYAADTLNHVQLYKDANGNYYTINTEYDGSYNSHNGMLYKFNYQDTLTITPIKDAIAYKSYNGYQYVDSATCLFNEYNLKYLTANVYGDISTNQYLSIAKDSILGVNQDANLAFQLVQVGERQNGYGPVKDTIKTDLGVIEPLARQAYILKVRDNNLIDNGWKYVAFHQDVVNQNPYYKMENLKNIDGQYNKLAVFYLKNDQYSAADTLDAFALIDVLGLDSISENYDKAAIYTDFTKATDASLISKVGELLKSYNPDDEYYNDEEGRMFQDNGWYRLAVEDQNAMSTIATLDNDPNTRVSAFVLSPVARQLYMPLTDKGVLAGNNIKIYRERGINGATKEYIYEDGNNATHVADGAYIKGFNYLGITGENIAPVGKDKTVAFYVDSVLHSQKVMPQYLLYVDRDTIGAGEWCNTGEHGYNAAGDSKTHQIKYNALSYGRVLVNLNDSVANYKGTSINMLENGLKYAFENYTRLGFVPAIHINIADSDSTSAFGFLGTGEWLVVLNNTTFDNVMSTVGSTKVIDPAALKAALSPKVATAKANKLDGNHQNYAFSFRYTDDTHVPFLMESKGFGHVGFPGTYTDASWVKVQDGVPVIAQDVQPSNNGEHTSIAANRTLQEVINQAQILKLTTTNEIATANDEIAASSVKVIAGNGVVTVKNAAGKKLVITNILGKAIANTVVTSDNATFAAPAGIVAVAVEGEPAVKAIVK